MLRVKDLICFRGDRALFEAVSFSLNIGDILQVCGPNGSGKTTLMRTLVGLYKNYTGCFDWDLPSPPLYLGHRPGINENLTPRENIKWVFELNNQHIKSADIEEAIRQVGLAESAHICCSDLSFGQKKRVALAPFCLGKNSLWIMDEPFSGIDGVGITLIEELFRKRSLWGGSIIFSSHQAIPSGLAVKKLELR